MLGRTNIKLKNYSLKIVFPVTEKIKSKLRCDAVLCQEFGVAASGLNKPLSETCWAGRLYSLMDER